MYFDLQKAGLWKRLSAFVLDFILLTILATLLMWTTTALSGYDQWYQRLQEGYSRHESQAGVVFDVTEAEYNSWTEEKKAAYDQAYAALLEDEETLFAYRKVMGLSLLSVTIGIFAAYLVLEFLVPLFLGDGRTIGKKIFGICLMRRGQYKVTHLPLFLRTIFGKCALLTMVPVLILFSIYFGLMGVEGLLFLLFLLILQIVLYATTRGNCLLQDILGDTVVVDYQSQKIFPSPEAVLEAKKRYARETAEKTAY